MMGKLNELPNELLLEVFEYISCKDLWLNVRLVCSKFASVIYASKLWKLKLKRFDVSLPQCQTTKEDFDVAQCCSAIEIEKNRWANDRLGKYVSITGHDATVDAIRLLNTSAHRRLCITGARDRSLILWDVDKIAMGDDSENWSIGMVTGAHQGWIWSVCTSHNDTFFSCGWDRYLKQWSLTNCDIQLMRGIELSSAALCAIDDRNSLVICSSFDHKIHAFDTRNKFQKVAQCRFHRGSVFELAQPPNTPYLYSCSADRTIVCTDKRMWKLVYDLELSAYAQSISYCDGQLLCGTTDGNLTLIDPNDLTILSKVEVANVSHIHQVKLNKGSQMCLMRTPYFNIFTPGLKPTLIARSAALDAEPARFDYFNGDLAITCGGGSVLFWTK